MYVVGLRSGSYTLAMACDSAHSQRLKLLRGAYLRVLQGTGWGLKFDPHLGLVPSPGLTAGPEHFDLGLDVDHQV